MPTPKKPKRGTKKVKEILGDEALWAEVQAARKNDVRKLAQLLWGENSIDLDEPEALAIGDTVLGRMAHPSYPDTLEEVLMQPKQYSPFNQGDPNYERVQSFGEGHPMWSKYSTLAAKALDPYRKRGSFTHYYAPNSVTPSWAGDLEDVQDIGRHRFGREKAETRTRQPGGDGVTVKGK